MNNLDLMEWTFSASEHNRRVCRCIIVRLGRTNLYRIDGVSVSTPAGAPPGIGHGSGFAIADGG